ncbi:MAG TPA: fructosamine kinase family protein [Cyclobacteriaceae bacterium]|nr:fructosamine kinase family protein [Cyclobacteriaceae bacterium]
MNSLPQPLTVGLTTFLSQELKSTVTIQNFTAIGGGCINNGGKITTSHGIFFVKWNSAKKFPGMFRVESNGLKLLSSAGAIRVPRVLGPGEHEGHQFIVMELIQAKNRSLNYWDLLGQELATLHKASSPYFGLDENNYMGSLPQFNEQKISWIEFFSTQRLDVQLKLAINSHAAPISLIEKFHALYEKLPTLLTEEKPSLVHGDLWSGNLITDENGNPCLIDPAVYYGNREVDLAMTHLFGGFDDEFYQSYQNAFPLPPGLQERIDIYNLYPLLVHVNLFGQSYLHQVLSILKTFD